MHFGNTELFHSPVHTDGNKSHFTPLLLLELGEILILGTCGESMACTEMQNSLLLTQLNCVLFSLSHTSTSAHVPVCIPARSCSLPIGI